MTGQSRVRIRVGLRVRVRMKLSCSVTQVSCSGSDCESESLSGSLCCDYKSGTLYPVLTLPSGALHLDVTLSISNEQRMTRALTPATLGPTTTSLLGVMRPSILGTPVHIIISLLWRLHPQSQQLLCRCSCILICQAAGSSVPHCTQLQYPTGSRLPHCA